MIRTLRGVHELSLLHGVVSAVENVAQERGASSVESVGLRVGSLSGVVRESLEGAWPLARAGTVCNDARLEIEWIVAAVWCQGCQADREIDEFYALTCPVCHAPTGQLTAGREFEVAYADFPSTA